MDTSESPPGQLSVLGLVLGIVHSVGLSQWVSSPQHCNIVWSSFRALKIPHEVILANFVLISIFLHLPFGGGVLVFVLFCFFEWTVLCCVDIEKEDGKASVLELRM